MKKLTILSLSSILMFILVGCKSMNQFSPEQVIANALEAEDNVTYYGEIVMKVNGVDEIDDTLIKEWRHENKTRMEFIADQGEVSIIQNGESSLIINKSENQAFLTAFAKELATEELYQNPRKQMEMLLDMVRDTHDIETVGEEKVTGRDSIYMVAKKQDGKKSVYGDIEMWVDKESWVLLKTKAIIANVELVLEYTMIDYEPKIDDSLFSLDVPEGVELQEIDSSFDGGEEITMEEIPEKLAQPVFYIPDKREHSIETIVFTEIEGEYGYKDVTIDYKRNGLPLMSLTMIKVDSLEEEYEFTEEELAMMDEIGERVSIRSEEGFFIDEDISRDISWTEDGINYSIHMIDPDLTLEDVLTLAEKMETIE